MHASAEPAHSTFGWRTVAAHVTSAGGVALSTTLAVFASSDADGVGLVVVFLVASFGIGVTSVAVARRMLRKSVATPWLAVGALPSLYVAVMYAIG